MSCMVVSPLVMAQVWDCGETLLKCSPSKWQSLAEDIQIEMAHDLFQKTPKLQIVFFVKDYEIQIQHLHFFGEPALSRIGTEGEAVPKSAKKILVDLLVSLQDLNF